MYTNNKMYTLLCDGMYLNTQHKRNVSKCWNEWGIWLHLKDK